MLNIWESIQPAACSRTVSAFLTPSVAGALPTLLTIVAIPQYRAELLLLALALVVFEADAMAILGARFDFTRKASSAGLPLPINLRVASL